MTRAMRKCAVVVGLLIGGAALAADLPKLPGALKLPQGDGSPGVVTFNHDMHVDTSKPAGSCTSCHAGTFRILGKSASTPATTITHDRMKAGQSCGRCHGKQAFNFDDCTMCHAM
ncbi:MAG: c(7)-type cytochrome triheme domain-containing protein [Anaeromyxobacteraceae bacterium]